MRRVVAVVLMLAILLAAFSVPAMAAPKNPQPSPGIDIGNGVTVYPEGTKLSEGAKGNGGGGNGGVSPQSSRTIKITVYMYGGCSTFYSPPGTFNPQGCVPLNNAAWKWKYAGAMFWQNGIGTDVTGMGYMYVPVTVGSSGTIWTEGYAGFQCQTNWYLTGNPGTCYLWSLQ